MSSSLPLWLNLLSQAVIVFLLSQISLSLLWFFSKTSIHTLRSQWQAILLWSTVSLPWLISVSCFFLAGQNEYFNSNNSVIQVYFHWHHNFIFSWQSWHGFSLIISLLISLYLCRKAYITLKNYRVQDKKRRVLSLLTRNSEGHFEHSQALAFTSGLIRPKVYISTGLVQQLTAEELVMVTLHEQAHADRFDPLQKWLFLLAASFFPRLIAQQLITAMELTMEYGADHKVSQRFDALDVAEALIKIARLMGSPSKQVEQRLHYLITPEQITSKSTPLNQILPLFQPLTILLLQVTLPLVAVVFALDFLHHLFDQWLWHFN